MLSLSRKFVQAAHDRDGAAAVIFAVSLLPVMIGVGAAIDYSAERRVQAELSSALDAATLSVAIASVKEQNINGSVSSQVEKQLKGGLGPLKNRSTNTTVTASLDTSTGTVTSDATLVVPTKFMALVGKRTMTVRAHSEVTAPGGPIEVAMALDTTGSMAGVKIDALKAAATTLNNTLFSVPNASTNVKVGVVPFDYYVNIGTASRGANWLTASADYSTTSYECWDEYPNATYTNPVTRTSTCYNDGAPYTCSWTDYTVNYGAPVHKCGNVTYNHTWNGCVGSRAYPKDVQGQADKADAANQVPALIDYWCARPLQRLTNDKALAQAAIDGLSASGETYIAPGLLWGWRVLSPHKPFADGAAYNGRTKKYLVLMTDGFNTHSPNYPDHEGSNIGDAACSDVTAANCLTKKTCDAIKAQGITVYSVAFQVTDLTIKGILQNCATSSAGYFDSASTTDLQNAFVAIGNSITAIRITR
jgi:Flp pilus assembly protein TadG